MRLLVRAAAVAAGAALAVSGLGPAVAVDVVSLSKAGPVSAWGYPAGGGTPEVVSDVTTIPASLQKRAVRAISVQQHLGVAATADGRVTAWGDADAVDAGAVPAPAGLRNVVDVRAINGINGISAIALSGDGRLTAWGAAGGGVKAIPAAIQGHVTAIDAGNDYVMAVTDDGRITQWGNSSQISSGLKVPADIQGKVLGISVSKDAGTTAGAKVVAPNLALLKDHTVVAWGTPVASDSAWTVPTDIQGIVKKVVTGPAPAAILDDGSVRFWGPTPDPTDPPNPQGCDTTPVVPGDTVPPYIACGLPQGLASQQVADIQIGSASLYAMALTETGEVYLWGGSKGAPTDNDTAMQVNWTGPVRTGASAIGFDVTGATVAAVVTTGFAIGSDPVVTGTARVGQVLKGTAGTFSGTHGPASSQWLANGVAIPGATGPTLALTSAYVGKRIGYRTTAVSGSSSLSATSAQTAAVVKPTPVVKPPVKQPNPQLAKDQAKLKQDQAKLKQAKKAYKKAHGHKKAKLKKKIAKLKKTIKADQRKIAADK